MKSTSIILILLFLVSCGKNADKQAFTAEENNSVAPYDTIAIDSFSQGAISVDIARKIKMSSLKYQDSLKQVKLKNEEEQLLKKAKEEKSAAENKAKANLERAKSSSASPKVELPVNQ